MVYNSRFIACLLLTLVVVSCAKGDHRKGGRIGQKGENHKQLSQEELTKTVEEVSEIPEDFVRYITWNLMTYSIHVPWRKSEDKLLILVNEGAVPKEHALDDTRVVNPDAAPKIRVGVPSEDLFFRYLPLDFKPKKDGVPLMVLWPWNMLVLEVSEPFVGSFLPRIYLGEWLTIDETLNETFADNFERCMLRSITTAPTVGVAAKLTDPTFCRSFWFPLRRDCGAKTCSWAFFEPTDFPLVFDASCWWHLEDGTLLVPIPKAEGDGSANERR